MIDIRAGQATYTMHAAFEALRAAALSDPGTWKVAESESAALTIAWLAGETGLDTPEAMRVTRRFVAPVADDLETVANAIPSGIEIGPIVPDPRTRSFVLGLRPRGSRPKSDHCPCGASPRYGTHLFGDAQQCAICALWGEPHQNPEPDV